jgi:hypothetical protein
MTAREDFGAPDASDILLAIGDMYSARGALAEGVRLFVSGIPTAKAADILHAVAIQLSSVPDA